MIKTKIVKYTYTNVDFTKWGFFVGLCLFAYLFFHSYLQYSAFFLNATQLSIIGWKRYLIMLFFEVCGFAVILERIFSVARGLSRVSCRLPPVYYRTVTFEVPKNYFTSDEESKYFKVLETRVNTELKKQMTPLRKKKQVNYQ